MQKQNHQQQQQQQIGVSGSQFRMSSAEMAAVPSAVVHQQQQQVVEEASPISSRPPAGNFDELGGDEDLVGGGSSGGNRWPRQETLALLKIRSEMDVAFRDANLKSPLWDQVSRKLGELGYTRSSKKCKEKFENVQKYYKRTKEGRAGRQDGKSYRFFSQLEALHGTTSITTTNTMTSASPTPLLTANVAPISIDFGTSHPMPSHIIPPTMNASQIFPPGFNAYVGPTTIAPVVGPHTVGGISFSSTSSSSGSESEDDDMDDLHEAEMSNAPGSHHGQKRKREKGGRSGTINNKMMEFFEGLMRQVMQKQEAMQQRFLETIEKREHDRMIRDEAWKRQEMSRLTREHELLAQDRGITASRDASIIAFLQKITGQNIQLPTSARPTHVATSSAPPPPASTTTTTTMVAAPPPQPPPPPSPVPKRQHLDQLQPHIFDQVIGHQQPLINSEAFMAVPEQQVPPQDPTSGGSVDPTSSRWPKIEVLALIKIRSGLETRYQEAGPKGPLWEDVSIGMQQMGYKRNAKRCKEKWENINKYFKKVKESNKSRPEDAKTCPYFHELDALYRRKVLGGSGTSGDGGSSISNQNISLQHQNLQQGGIVVNLQEHERGNLGTPQQTTVGTEMEKGDNSSTILQTNNGASLFGQGSDSVKNVGHTKPEDIMKGLMEQQRRQQQLMRAPLLGELDHSDEDEDENIDDESEEDMKMAYKIEFQPKQNANNGTTSSFAAMVQ